MKKLIIGLFICLGSWSSSQAVQHKIIGSRIFEINTQANEFKVTNTETKKIRVFKTGRSPYDFIVADKHVYITNHHGSSVTHINLATDEVRHLKISTDPSILIHHNNELWITHTRSPFITVVDCQFFTETKKISTPYATCGINACDGKAFVLHPLNSSVTILDLNTQSILKTVITGKAPTALIGTDERLYVANAHSNTVSIICLKKFIVIKTIRVGPKPLALLLDSSFIYVHCSDSNTISLIDDDDPEFKIIRTLSLKHPGTTIKRHNHGLSCGDHAVVYPFFPTNRVCRELTNLKLVHLYLDLLDTPIGVESFAPLNSGNRIKDFMDSQLGKKLFMHPDYYKTLHSGAIDPDKIRELFTVLKKYQSNQPEGLIESIDSLIKEALFLFCVSCWKNDHQNATFLLSALIQLNVSTALDIGHHTKKSGQPQSTKRSSTSKKGAYVDALIPCDPLSDLVHFPVARINHFHLQFTANYATDSISITDPSGETSDLLIKVGHKPCLLAGCHNYLFVTHQGEKSVYVIDIPRRKVCRKIDLDFIPTDLGTCEDTNCIMIFSKQDSYLFVFNLPDLKDVTKTAQRKVAKEDLASLSESCSSITTEAIFAKIKPYIPQDQCEVQTLDHFYQLNYISIID